MPMYLRGKGDPGSVAGLNAFGVFPAALSSLVEKGIEEKFANPLTRKSRAISQSNSHK